MLKANWHKDSVVLYMVVNEGFATRVIQYAKSCGITGATVMLGRGTIRNRFLNILGILDSSKEIIIMGADRETGLAAMHKIAKRMHFEKPKNGIAFALQMSGIVGAGSAENWPDMSSAAAPSEPSPETGSKWHLITVIVDLDRADDVVEAAQRAGASGGTIVMGRGSGVAQTKMLFDFEIEPEKEIVFMLAPSEISSAIEDAIDEDLQLSKPNHGILFTQDVLEVTGLYRG